MSQQNRPASQSPVPTEDEQRRLNHQIRLVKKGLKKGSFNAEYWTNSAELENLQLQRTEISRKASMRDWEGAEPWENIPRGQEVKASICAHQASLRIAKKRADNLDPENAIHDEQDRARRHETGTDDRNSGDQSSFRKELIATGDAKHPKFEWLWVPVLGRYWPEEEVVAAHLFPCMHGQESMDDIFGKTKSPELFSARNGILVPRFFEKYLNAGKILIVPDLPDDRPPLAELLAWVSQETREFKLRIIDPKWEKLDHLIHLNDEET
ncbi:uncharacterized protein DSM5745_01318 [Aspergillus mulundensis]|uniref:HNH nuclease domain-containing protein n=1 Tax=Aspergillus mulundensis TaxID=1810919 RepID=A0A3D8T601_9EURO|nr:hypothetical protein DSM5745_01318 [Aspergillus mulundensis]RDW93996.1 hypothetical protein DSM5745_01318 [Aspergillus mulundensis]